MSTNRSSSRFVYEGRPADYIADEQSGLTVGPAQTYELFDEDIHSGVILAYEVSTDNPKLALQVQIFGDISQRLKPYNINKFTMNDLLSQGRGLTPGEIEDLPSSQSPDPIGRESPIFPYLARWKTDSFADILGEERVKIVSRYNPTQKVPYNRIVARLVNTDTTTNAFIYDLLIIRVVFLDTQNLPRITQNKGFFSTRPEDVVKKVPVTTYDNELPVIHIEGDYDQNTDKDVNDQFETIEEPE